MQVEKIWNGWQMLKTKEKRKRAWTVRGVAVPFGLHVVLPDMSRRARAKRSASINSCYITSLCWCQVAERKERRESAMTLFFSVVRPHLARFLSVSFHSGFVSMDTDRLCVYPTLQGAQEMLVPLLSFSFILLLSLLSLLDHHTSFIMSFLHHATLVLAFQVISKHRWCLDVAAQILKPRCEGQYRNTTAWLDMKVQVFASDSVSVKTFLQKS